MPALSSDAAVFRAGFYRYTGFIATVPPVVVMRGTLSATPTFPALTLAYTVVSGSYSSIKPGMTVRVLSGGVQKGLLRVATGGTITSVSLPVNEFSANTCNAANGDTIEVLADNRIWDKLVSATAALKKDSRITYSDQGVNPPPVAVSGGPYANLSEHAAGVDFYGSHSWVVDPDSSTVSHAWDFKDGTPSSSSDADPLGVTFPDGFRIIEHTVTDTGNSKSSTQYIPVWVQPRSGTDAPLSARVQALSATDERGWRMEFSLPVAAQAHIDALPDGVLIVYYEEERNNTTISSYGSDLHDRSHIKFCGYLVRDTVTITPDNREVTFEAVSPLGILEQTPALTQLITSKTSPAKWSELKGLTIKRALWYLLYWGSTYTDVFDLLWKDAPDLSYPSLAMQDTSNLLAQINDLLESINAPLTCDRLGRLLADRNPNFETSGERTARVKVYNLTTADVTQISITREHRGEVKHIRGEGITTGGAAVFSNAGKAPSPIGTDSDTLSKQIVTSQTDLNTRTGYAFAEANGLYNGRFVPQGVRLSLPAGYDFFDPALRNLCSFELSEAVNPRGVAFGASEWWLVRQVDVRYDNDNRAKSVELTLDHETSGAAGVTYIPPQSSDNGLGDYPPLDLSWPGLSDMPAGTAEIDTSTIAVFDNDSWLFRTTDFNTPEVSGGPTWSQLDLETVGTWPGGVLVQFVVDAYSPKYLGTGAEVNGWVATTTHVARILDVFGTPSFTGAYELRASSSKRSLQAERGQQNFVVCATWYNADGVYAAVTTNGTTWTETEVTPYYHTGTSNIWTPGLYVSPHVNNKAMVGVWKSSGTTTATAGIYVTTNAGGSWAEISPAVDAHIALVRTIVIPFQNAAENVMFYADYELVGPNAHPRLYRRKGGSDVNISPQVSGEYFGPAAQYFRTLVIPDDDQNTLLMVGHGDTGTGQVGVFLTRNSQTGATWEIVVAPGTGVNWRLAYAVGGGRFILLGINRDIAVLADGVLDSRKGNLSASPALIGLCGG